MSLEHREERYSKEFIKRFFTNANIKTKDDCWEWKRALQTNGYGSVAIYGKKTALAHRVAYEIVYGEIPEGLCVLHKCDNRKCVNPKHLFLGTIDDNNKDMVRKGRQAKGEKNGRSKLTVREVIMIRELHSNGGLSIRELAELFPVCYNSIRNIVNEDYWRLPLAE